MQRQSLQLRVSHCQQAFALPTSNDTRAVFASARGLCDSVAGRSPENGSVAAHTYVAITATMIALVSLPLTLAALLALSVRVLQGVDVQG